VLASLDRSIYAPGIRQARSRIEEKTKSPRSKIMRLDEAVKQFVKEGSHVAIGGCLYSRTPTATIHEIIRQRVGGLTISRSLAGMEADLLVSASLLKKVVTSWWSVGYAWGISKVMRKSTEEQHVIFEEWSHLSLGLRYRAAAMGVTFLPTFSMLGSDYEKLNEIKRMDCPYTGEKILLVPALYPDVGIIHAQVADELGNVRIDGYEFMDNDIARASNRVIVTVERIVDSEEFRKQPERTNIPFFCVDAVVELPYGAYPSECWNIYDADFDHFSRFTQQTSERQVEGAKQYVAEFIHGTKSFQDFLAKIGESRLQELRRSMSDVVE
jgi:glutaconate CoA-transferase subunit A